MSDTTGNQDLAIATNGTSHVAVTMGPTDVCKLPNNTPAPFPNWIAAQGNLKDGTTNTFIANQPVWIQRSHLGPVSDPGHAGVNTGVGSGTYRGIARATSWSKDVQKEGQFVVRTNDSTTQNNANTSGTVMGSPLAGSADAQDEYLKKLCTITKLEGKCGHGRELGPPPGAKKDDEPNYLEILKGDKVTFTSTRENLVTKDLDPKCVKGIHTHWEATRTGGSWKEAATGAAKGAIGLDPTTHESKDAEKVYELGGDLTGESSVKIGKTKSKTSNVNDFARREWLKTPQDGGVAGKTGKVTANGSTGEWAHGDAVTHKVPKDSTAEKLKSGALSTITQAAVMWDAAAHPAIVTVESSACSGKKTATIKIMPSDTVEVDLFSDTVKALIAPLKKVPFLVERATSFFGVPARIQILESPKLKFVLAYKELKQDRPKRPGPFGFGTLGPHYKVQCRRSWKLEFGFSPLIGGYAKFTAPITAALPLVGSAAAWLIKLVGAKGDIFVKFELSFAPKGSVAWDEYDEISVNVSSGNELEVTFSIGVEVYVKVAEVTVYGYMKGKITFEKFGPRPGLLLACDMKGEMQFGAKGAAKANFWGKTYSKDIKYEPDCLKVGGEGSITVPLCPKLGSSGP